MEIVPFVAEALGDSSYLLVSGAEAAVVDPQRDLRPYLAAAEARGVRITRAFETHVHNDYISGSPALLALGVTVIAPAGSKLEFPHQPVRDGDAVTVGSVVLRAIATPGHTFEHTAYVVEDYDRPAAAFTGGNLLVGAAGRSDLLGPEATLELARLQWESGRRLAALLRPGSDILPTHGAGSFCSSTGGPTERSSRLEVEVGRNPVLTSADFDTFRATHLGSPSPTPGYYRYMASINRAGNRRSPFPPYPPRLTPAALIELSRAVPLLDVRARSEYAAAHVPGSVTMEENPSLLGYLSWLYEFDAPLALVTYDPHQAERVTGDLHRIGYEHVRGFLPFHEWLEQGHDSEPFQTVEVAEAANLAAEEAGVIDVRFEREHIQSPLPGARQLPIDRIREWAPEVGPGPVLVVCASGQRATIAASYLASRGVRAVPLIRGGAADLGARR